MQRSTLFWNFLKETYLLETDKVDEIAFHLRAKTWLTQDFSSYNVFYFMSFYIYS